MNESILTVNKKTLVLMLCIFGVLAFNFSKMQENHCNFYRISFCK